MRLELLALLVGCGDNLHGVALDAVPDVPAGTPITVTLTNHPPEGATDIVAYQDGDNPWQPAPLPNGDVYTFYVQSDRWGFVHTCAHYGPQHTSYVDLTYYTVAEKTSLLLFGCSSSASTGTATVSGTVSGLPSATSGTEYTVSYQFRQTTLVKSQTAGSFTLTNVDAGPHDLLVTHVPPGTVSFPPADGIAIVHDVVAPTTTPVAIDWTTAGLATATMSIDAPGGSGVSVFMDVVTRTSDASLGGQRCTTNPCSVPIIGAPTALLAATDSNRQLIYSSDPISSWQLERFVSTVEDVAIIAPPPLSNVMVVAEPDAPYPRIATTWSVYSGATSYSWWVQNSDRVWDATVSPGYVGSSPAFEMPDLSQIPGWSTNVFGLYPRNFVQGSVSATVDPGGVLDCKTVDCPPPIPPAQLTYVTSSWKLQLQ